MYSFEWDENKRKINIAKHKSDFSDAIDLWNSKILIVEDKRVNYSEQRWIGFGLLYDKVMTVVFTQPKSNTIRIISFRKANRREIKYYEEGNSQNNKICNIYSRTIKTYEKPN